MQEAMQEAMTEAMQEAMTEDAKPCQFSGAMDTLLGNIAVLATLENCSEGQDCLQDQSTTQSFSRDNKV